MLTKSQHNSARLRAIEMLADARIILTEEEKSRIEVADFDLNNLENVGLQLLVYVNTDRVCAKELVLFPYQTCPEHKHVDNIKCKGKEETFRVRKGTCYLYINGTPAKEIKARMPETTVTHFHEIVLNEGEQYTLMPDTWHWFQAGENGAVVSEFSTMSTDEFDIFTDKRIARIPRIADEDK